MRRPVQFDPLDLAAAISGRKHAGPARDVPVLVLPRASISKLAPVDDAVHPIGPFCMATYAAPITCPPTCPHRNEPCTCYVWCGPQGGKLKRLDLGVELIPTVSEFEAAAVLEATKNGVPQDGARGGRDLRLHAGGDVDGPRGARALGRMAEEYINRGGGAIWTYTHRALEIPQCVWGPALTVFASVETMKDARAAARNGYPIALAVPEFPSLKTFTVDGMRFMPCRYEVDQIKGRKPPITCVECRFCLGDMVPKKGLNVAFQAHGKEKKEAKAKLQGLLHDPSGSIGGPVGRVARRGGRRIGGSRG